MQSAVEPRLEQFPARFAKAWNAKDAQALFADFIDDADFVDASGVRRRGTQDCIREYAARFADGFCDSTLTFLDVRVRALGTRAAVISAYWVLRGHQDPAGHWAPARTGILLCVAQRLKEGWKIVASQNTRQT